MITVDMYDDMDGKPKFSVHQPNPNEVFTGTFQVVRTPGANHPSHELEARFAKKPIVVDRRTGKILIHDGQWLEYDEWLRINNPTTYIDKAKREQWRRNG